MNGLTFTPWTRSTLLAQSGSTFDPTWTLENNTKSLFGNTVPSSDLPWTCPFGAQFQFENYIPAS